MLFQSLILLLVVNLAIERVHSNTCNFTPTSGQSLEKVTGTARILKQDSSHPTQTQCFQECCDFPGGACDTALFFTGTDSNCYLVACHGTGCLFQPAGATGTPMIRAAVIQTNATVTTSAGTTQAGQVTLIPTTEAPQETNVTGNISLTTMNPLVGDKIAMTYVNTFVIVFMVSLAVIIAVVVIIFCVLLAYRNSNNEEKEKLNQ